MLVPTRELAEQVRGQIGRLVEGLGIDANENSSKGEGGIRVVNIVGGGIGNSRKKRKGANGAGGERVERLVGFSLVFFFLEKAKQTDRFLDEIDAQTSISRQT